MVRQREDARDPLRQALLAELGKLEQQCAELRRLVGEPASVAVLTQAKVLLGLEALGARAGKLAAEWGEGKSLYPEAG